MSDERDETRSFSPFDDDTWADDAARPGRRRPSPQSPPGDRTQPQPPAGDDASRPQPPVDEDATRLQPPVGDDATRMQPPVGEDETRTQPLAGDDATRLQPPVGPDATRVQPGAIDDPTVPQPGGRLPDATSVMPPVEDGGAWAGRAEVRAPQPAPTAYQQVTEWPVEPGRPRNDRWWMPIVVGIVVLILLAALGWGIYLIVQNSGKDNSPGPVATTSAAPAPTTAPATTESPAPSSEPTTTSASPSATASTTEPTDDAVEIPALRGLTVADAKAALAGVGITSTHVIYRSSDAEPDTVIDSDPEEGQEVPPDTRVTLVVSAPNTGVATTSPTPAATGGGN